MKKYLAAVLAMSVIAACAGGMKASRAPTTSPAETGAPPQMGSQAAPDHASPKDELNYLYAQVEQEREQDHVAEPQVASGSEILPFATEPDRTPKTDPTCKPAPSDTCNTSCTLSGSICKNKDRICELAKDLGDDDSIGKCNKAAKTCKTSADKCCSCML